MSDPSRMGKGERERERDKITLINFRLIVRASQRMRERERNCSLQSLLLSGRNRVGGDVSLSVE